MGGFNKWIFKALLVVALAPIAMAMIAANPLVGILVALICASILIPTFRPFQWVTRGISGIFTGLFKMINTVLSGTFSLIGITVAGFFSLLTLGWLPLGRGAKFLGGYAVTRKVSSPQGVASIILCPFAALLVLGFW